MPWAEDITSAHSYEDGRGIRGTKYVFRHITLHPVVSQVSVSFFHGGEGYEISVQAATDQGFYMLNKEITRRGLDTDAGISSDYGSTLRLRYHTLAPRGLLMLQAIRAVESRFREIEERIVALHPALPPTPPSIPIPEYSKCPGCLDDIDAPEPTDTRVIRTLACGHKIHAECFEQWRAAEFGKSRGLTCPICRRPIPPQ